MKKFNWQEISQKILEAFGGKENIKNYFHCATRLRVYVFDESKVNKNDLEKMQLVKGVNLDGDQWQIIYGAGTVNKVFSALENEVTDNLKNTNKELKIKKSIWNSELKFKSNLFLVLRWLIRSFAEIFVPLIPIFIAGGISLAINSFIQTVAKDSVKIENSTAWILSKIFDLIGGAILGSLPVFLGYTAMKKFGGTPILGMAIGLIMVSPALINGWNSSKMDEVKKAITLFPSLPEFFQFKFIGYQAQVFPVLLIIGFAFYIEKYLKKYIHESIAIIVVPLFTVFITVFFGFWIIGPIGRYIGLGIGISFDAIFKYTNFPGFGLGGAIIGFAYPYIVVTGLHQGFTGVEAQLLQQFKFTWITSIATVSNISQGMAGIALFIILFKKSKQGAAKAISGSLSANLGITEPIMFGTNIPLFFPMLAASIASAIGGYWIGMSQTVAHSIGSASWLGFIQFPFVKSTDLDNYYQNYEIAVSWGKYMYFHKALTPIANIAIAASIASIASISLTFVFSRTFGKKSLNKFIEQNQN